MSDHQHANDEDVIAISIVDFSILILCIFILIHFIKYILNKNNYNLGESLHTSKYNLFRISDIICLLAIILYFFTIIILLAHDILHFIDIDPDYYCIQLGVSQWILFFIARVMLQASFAFKLFVTFHGSAITYNNYVYIILFTSIFCLFCYGIYIVVIMGENEEILSPLSHHYATILSLIFTSTDFVLIMLIAYLFISKLYVGIKLMNITDSSDNMLCNQSMMESNKAFLNAISKYSLLTTFISIMVMTQLVTLWIISIHYDHDDEVHVEYLQHCISTIVVSIDLVCLYLSCRLTKPLYAKICKYPHKFCNKLCEKTILIKYKRFKDEVKLRDIQITPTATPTPKTPTTKTPTT